jgi:toxin ParE1/3/4
VKRARVTRDAERDLDDIWIYIARDSTDAADRFVDDLTSRFPLLASAPRLGRTRDDIQRGLRSHTFGAYVIYYRQSRRGVSILRVVHGARDPSRIFRTGS